MVAIIVTDYIIIIISRNIAYDFTNISLKQ